MDPQNANRLRVKELVSLSPGIHLRKLQRVLGISWTTARYHVRNLVLDGEIVSWRDRGHSRLFPAGTADDMKAVYGCLQSKSARKVLGQITAATTLGLTQAELSESVRLSRSTVSSCVAALDKAGLVRRSSMADGRVTLEVQDRALVMGLLATFGRTKLDVATDRFSDLWDI